MVIVAETLVVCLGTAAEGREKGVVEYVACSATYAGFGGMLWEKEREGQVHTTAEEDESVGSPGGDRPRPGEVRPAANRNGPGTLECSCEISEGMSPGRESCWP